LIRTLDIEDKIRELGAEMPPEESFLELGDLTALRRDTEGRFYRSNYQRGILLYALVATYRPKTILEFGTGRGYGALCMARALVDCGIDGQVYSIDFRRFDEEQDWCIDRGDGPNVERLSLSGVWSQHCPRLWTERVWPLTGTSATVMAHWKRRGLPPPDFAFIDGSHDYSPVKHDFYSFLNVASVPFRVLFADYTRRPDFGVPRLIDEDVAPFFHADALRTSSRWHPSQIGQPLEQDHGMVFVDSERVERPIGEAFPAHRVRTYLNSYRRQLRFRRATRLFRSTVKRLVRRPNNR